MPSTLRKIRPVSAAAARFPPETKAAPSSLSTSLTLAAMSLGYGVVQLDVTIVNTSLNSIGTSLGGGVSELQWVVSSLYHRLCRLHSHRGRTGRSHRREAGIHGGFCHLHGRVGGLRPGAQRHHPDRGPSGPGTWRGHPGSELAGVAQPRLSGRKAARPRGRHLGGRCQPCAHRRTAGRRRADCAGRLAVDLPRQSADRPCRPVAELALCRRNHAIAAAPDRSAGPDRGDRHTGLSGRRHHRRRHAGLGQSVW